MWIDLACCQGTLGSFEESGLFDPSDSHLGVLLQDWKPNSLPRNMSSQTSTCYWVPAGS